MYIPGLLIYFAVLVALGYAASRKNPDFEAYFYAKRKLGAFFIFFTVTASWFGAASTLATIEEAGKSGFSALWLLGIPTLITVILFILLNRRIRETHFVSLPLLLKKHYGETVGVFASFLIFVYMVLLAASQLAAWGNFSAPFLGRSYEMSVLIGAAVVILYSGIGGYLSVVLTDGLQFFLFTGAIGYLFFFYSGKTPVWSPQDFDVFSGFSRNILMTVSFTLAWLISPIIWQRIASARSARSSRRGLLMSIFAFCALYYMIIIVGIQLRSWSAVGARGTGSQALSLVVMHLLTPAGGMLVFIGIAAAIMSTMDTALNLASLTMIRDVLRKPPGKQMVKKAQAATLLAGLLAALTALRFASVIKILGLASEIMAEGLFIPGIYLLFSKRKKPTAALLSLIFGGGFALLAFINAYNHFLPIPEWPHSMPYGLGLSAFGFIAGLWRDRTTSSSGHSARQD